MVTELRLGLPGNGGGGSGEVEAATRKRGFSETVDLKLNLSSKEVEEKDPIDEKSRKACPSENKLMPTDKAKPPAKAQVVGWPPVRSFRKNMLAVQKSSNEKEKEKEKVVGSVNPCFVKVSLEGAPFLRKLDLKMYKSYQQLSDALANMFGSFGSTGKCGYNGMKDFLSENKLKDLLNGRDYVPTYEDKDGDWMLVGDVPWEMFVVSCKRLRIMKATEATRLAPRAMENGKNKS